MFFLFFFAASHPYFDMNTSILAPMKRSGMSDGKVGQYTMRGSTLSFKTFVRLNSFVGKNDFGGICSRKKNMYDNWGVQIGFGNLKKSKNFSRKNTFFYSEELCPEKSLVYHGFSIDFESINSAEEVNVTYRINEGKINSKNFQSKTLCTIQNIKESGKHRVMINYKDGMITVEVPDKDNAMIKCGESFNYSLVNGYFSMMSETKGEVEYNDLLYFVVHPRSEKKENPNEIEEEEAKNERKLAKSKFRKVQKQYQKMAHPTVTYYMNELQKLNRTLQGVSSSNELQKAFLEVKEQIEKAGNGLTISELKLFIEETVNDKIQAANKKLEYSANVINEFREDFTNIYSSTVNAMKTMNSEMKEMMMIIDRSTKDMIRTIPEKRKIISYSKVSSDVTKQSSAKLTKILSLICALEMIFYCCFFIYKRRKTHDFKKID